MLGSIAQSQKNEKKMTKVNEKQGFSKNVRKNQKILSKYSNLSLIYAHCVHLKMRKDTRDRKDKKDTKYTYYIGCLLILLLVKSTLGTFLLLTICLLHLYI